MLAADCYCITPADADYLINRTVRLYSCISAALADARHLCKSFQGKVKSASKSPAHLQACLQMLVCILLRRQFSPTVTPVGPWFYGCCMVLSP